MTIRCAFPQVEESPRRISDVLNVVVRIAKPKPVRTPAACSRPENTHTDRPSFLVRLARFGISSHPRACAGQVDPPTAAAEAFKTDGRGAEVVAGDAYYDAKDQLIDIEEQVRWLAGGKLRAESARAGRWLGRRRRM